MFAFPGQLAAALCNQAALCCFGDASTIFNTALCQSDNLTTGFQGSSFGANLLDGGNVAFDPVKAQNCLNDFSSIDCRTDQLTTADMAALFPDCFGALTGTLPLNAPCQGSIECLPGEFCGPLPDGGMACQAVRGAGGSCLDFFADGGAGSSLSTSTRLNTQGICSYRGSGNTNLYCNYTDRTTGRALSPDGGWTCLPALDVGSQCVFHQDCTSKVCSAPTRVCGGATSFFNSGGCNHYKIPDAGGD
jgi:hypothetical protein